MERQPCPFRIVDDIGVAYSIGICLGSYHFYDGLRNSLRGERLRGALKNYALRAPIMGGNFAMWGLCFSSFDCMLTKLRKKEDVLNPIGGGFFTGFILAWRGGLKIAIRNGIGGAILLGLLESSMLAVGRAQTSMALGKDRVPPPPDEGVPVMSPYQREREYNFIPFVKYKKDDL